MTQNGSLPTGEPLWRTYFKTAAFLAPPLLVWAFACVFLVPKLQTIWRDTGFEESWAIKPMQMVLFISDNAGLLALGVVAVLVLLEWKSSSWPKFRRALLGSFAFLLNTAVLLLFAMMLTGLLMAAPAIGKVN